MASAVGRGDQFSSFHSIVNLNTMISNFRTLLFALMSVTVNIVANVTFVTRVAYLGIRYFRG